MHSNIEINYRPIQAGSEVVGIVIDEDRVTTEGAVGSPWEAELAGWRDEFTHQTHTLFTNTYPVHLYGGVGTANVGDTFALHVLYIILFA